MCNIDFEAANPIYRVREGIINRIISEYPFIERQILSQSLCGRNIDCLRIGNQNNCVLLTAAYHGMEWLTSLLLLKFTKELCESIKCKKPISDVKLFELINSRGVCIVPCVNPDGVEISLSGAESAGKYSGQILSISNGNTSSWQANARGVDINHNFNAGWHQLKKLEIENGISSPSSTRYGGTHPESEPETKAITSLCRKSSFTHAIAFHSQGEEIYWRYGDDISEKSELIAKVLSISSGYKMNDPQGLAVGGGFKDWFINEFKLPAFTIEIGTGKNPLPLSDLSPIYKRLFEMLVISIII